MVTDFGIARAAEGDAKLTVTGVAVGTPAYMSPEQALGEREVDGRSDIYSLGVVGYQMLAGEPPFKAANTPAMMMKHLTERLRPVREVRPDAPPDIAAVIEHALAKKPEDRFSSAAEMAAALAHRRDGARLRQRRGERSRRHLRRSRSRSRRTHDLRLREYQASRFRASMPPLALPPSIAASSTYPWAHPAAFPIGPDGLPVHPMSRREWKEWRRNYRDQVRLGVDGRPLKTIGERIVHFRKHVMAICR